MTSTSDMKDLIDSYLRLQAPGCASEYGSPRVALEGYTSSFDADSATFTFSFSGKVVVEESVPEDD